MFDYRSILSFIKKNITVRDVLLIGLIVLLFLATRLINLEKWPQFSDEGIYIRWAKVAWRDASWRFISVTDGRQPLQTWGTIPFLKIFWPNALLAGRMFSVSTGFVALCGTFTLLYYLWGKRAAFMGAFIYLFMPYFVFYDRMALVDSAVNAGFIWIVFFSIWLAKERRLDTALMFGFVGGLTLLAKSSARIFLAVAATAPLLFLSKRIFDVVQKSINYYFLLAISLSISLLFYNVQRLSPFFHYVSQKNTTFVLTAGEFIQNPFLVFPHNIKIIPQYVAWEAGFVIILFSVLGLIKLYRNDKNLFLYLLCFFVIPFFVIAFMAKVVFPRYLIFNASLLLITAVYFFHEYKSKYTYYLLAFLIATMLFFDYPFLFNPAKASFPPVDRGQYVEGVTAVWGAEKLMDLMREKSQVKPVLILAEGNFGLVADVLDVYLRDGDRIEIRGLWPLDRQHLIEAQADLNNGKDVYIVFSHRKEFPGEWPMELVKKYTKPNSTEALYLFKLRSVAR